MYIPSAEMGDYEEARNPRKKSGPLYPLTEEGSYGAPPREKPKPRPPLPGYEKRERKAKVYASYAVSNECSMHSHKLDKNERAARGRTPPSRKDSGPSRKDSVPRSSNRNSVPRQQPQQQQHQHQHQHQHHSSLTRQNSVSRRTSVPRQRSVSRQNSVSRHAEERPTKWQNSLRDQNYADKPVSWKDSLRGLTRDSVSPTPRQQRRPSSTMNRKPAPRKDSESVSPVRRPRTVSSSPDRRRQSSSPGMMGRGDKSSTDWGYTDFSTFTANRRSSEYSQGGSRKSSAMTDRSSMGRQSVSSRDFNNSRDYTSSGRDYPSNIPTGYTVANRDYSSSSERDYKSRRSGDFTAMYNQSASTYNQGGMTTSSFSSATYSKSTGSKIGLSGLKAPVINEWDDLGVLGLSSKMFKDSSSQQQNGFMSGSSSSFMRRESVTTKVM